MKDLMHDYQEMLALVVDGWAEAGRVLVQEWAEILADAWHLVRSALA